MSGRSISELYTTNCGKRTLSNVFSLLANSDGKIWTLKEIGDEVNKRFRPDPFLLLMSCVSMVESGDAVEVTLDDDDFLERRFAYVLPMSD